MAPQPQRVVVRPSPDLCTLSSVTDDTIVTRLRERVSVNAPWSRASNSLLIYVNRFNGEADQFPSANDPEGEPGLDEVCSRIGRWMHLEGSTEQSIILLYSYYIHKLMIQWRIRFRKKRVENKFSSNIDNWQFNIERTMQASSNPSQSIRHFQNHHFTRILSNGHARLNTICANRRYFHPVRGQIHWLPSRAISSLPCPAR